MTAGRLILLGTFAAAACAPSPDRQPIGQIVLYVDTDAPVPDANPRPWDPMVPAPLFDRVRIELYEPGQTTPCKGCSNELAVSAPDLTAFRVSIGVAPRPGVDGYRARVRLFPGRFKAADGEPRPATTIDMTVALPKVAPEGIVEATVLLNTDDVGNPVGSLDAPAPVQPSRPKTSLTGTWPGARRIACANPARAGEVCVPGGAFWMGNPDALQIFGPAAMHLVVLSPFFLDATEVTVRAFRASGLAQYLIGWTGSPLGDQLQDYCTFTGGPGGADPMDQHAALPVNCLDWSTAGQYCKARGTALPTEAEFEYAASHLDASLFTWGGSDAPMCGDAVFGRTGYGALSALVGVCQPPTAMAFLSPPGEGARDFLPLPGGSIVDLAGSLSEWTRDLWNEASDPCWSTPGVLHDPDCETHSVQPASYQVTRGGSWLEEGEGLEAAIRARVPLGAFGGLDVGFRCARPDQP